MPEVTTIYKREELYQQVWTRPMREIAKQYGVSDVALANACRKLCVTRPSRGYWAKKAAGQVVKPAVLPALKPGQSPEYKVSKWVYPPPPSPTPEEQAFRARPEFQPQPIEVPFSIEIAPKLERPHRLVAATKRALLKAKPGQDGLRWPGISEQLEVKVSGEQIGRAMRILDALLKGVETAGHQIRPAAGYEKPAEEGENAGPGPGSEYQLHRYFVQ